MFASNNGMIVNSMFIKEFSTFGLDFWKNTFSRMVLQPLLFVIITFCFIGGLFSQPVTSEKAREIAGDTLNLPDTAKNDLLLDLFDNDTIEVQFAYYKNLQLILPFDDSLISPQLRQIDVARQFLPNLFSLGNIGSPSISPLIKPEQRDVFDMGIHSYDAYSFTFDNFKFYKPQTPYTHVRYGTSTGIRDDNVFAGTLSRTFAKNLTVNVDYKRFNQVGEFNHDRSRNTNFAVGFEKSHWKNRFKTHLIYTYNQYLREENGGIQSDANLLLNNNVQSSRLSTPIFTELAGSKSNSWGVLLNNDFALFKVGDSLSRLNSDKGLHLGYEISYKKDAGLYYDTQINSSLDSFYYRNLNTDIRGIRNSYYHNNFKNTVYISAIGKENSSSGQADYLKAGLSYERHLLKYQPTDSSFSVLKLIADGQWDLPGIAGINASGYYLLNSLTPIYNLEGRASGKINKILDAEVWLNVRNLPPGFLYQHLNLNSVKVYNTNGNNIFTTYFGGKVFIPFINLGVSLHQNIITNYTYFDNNYKMQQLGGATSITGVQAKYDLKLGAFHLDNDVLWQATTATQVRIPTLATTHAVYLEAKLFKKKLLINAGVDVRYLSEFDRMGYNPMLFNFYNADGAASSSMFTYDVFISYKIRLLRGFVRVDNINNIYDKKAQYQIDRYPIDKFAIKFGFDWIFNN